MKVCQFWSCNSPIRSNHFLCIKHFDDWDEYLIDKCPSCGQYKDVEYPLCLNCKLGKIRRKKPFHTAADISKDKKLEYSPTWGKGDKKANAFYVYILKLSNGSFYVGQTRDLRERMSEHRDNKKRTTAGLKPKLVYHEEKHSRYDAVSRESELKDLAKSNERQLRKMITEFRDKMREVSLE